MVTSEPNSHVTAPAHSGGEFVEVVTDGQIKNKINVEKVSRPYLFSIPFSPPALMTNFKRVKENQALE
jgi:hypothetical protein